tara:strand:- start:3962 stop:4228 length:267 start_codon:yes stop_codon:yes gene_type:complete
MTIKTKHGNFEVRELTFQKRRELHRLEISTLDANGKVDLEKYYDVMEFVMSYAFDDPEASLSHLDDTDIDIVLSDIYSRYKNPPKKKN